LLPPVISTWADWRASTLGIGADRAIVAAGFLEEESYLHAYAAAVGIRFEPLTHVRREHCPIDDDRLLAGMAAGILPLRIDDELVCVVAPRCLAARQMAQLVARTPDLQRHLRVTSTERLTQFVTSRAGVHLGTHAAEALRTRSPRLSAVQAAPTMAWPWWPPLAAAAVALSFTVPDATWAATETSFSLLFLVWMLARLLGACFSHPLTPATDRRPDAELPLYTVIVAIYREAASVADLAAALKQLDWPVEKLDIKFVIEADDNDTRAAIERLELGPEFEVIVAPVCSPQTKPKALNAALPFARGTFTVIYDAEDRPEPDQLRTALATFLAHDRNIACVQAALTIDNTADSWLARMFTAEYAAHFDVLLPFMAAMRLPLPLGGSSNHFRTDILRAVGAWDPYNVTEDADLGVRLARCGYRCTIIGATTYEEAPARLHPWLRQRTRWFKGWMQTWLVHTREPRQLLRDLGGAGFATFHVFIGGSVLTALIYPLFLTIVLWRVASGTPIFHSWLAWLHATVLFGGVLTSALIWVVGLSRRNLLGSAWVVALAPVHWMLLSVAAWRALWQLVSDPHRWEKTEHGLAKSSRLGRHPAWRSAPERLRADDPRRSARRIIGAAHPTAEHVSGLTQRVDRSPIARGGDTPPRCGP
jgi:cellulose synthase/poly-beta-1,6-N-acetylglucosamine synthase-like glycosyltransferase